jgi:hypothetical protein
VGSGHLTNPELVAFLDGECPDASRPATTAHLEACWQCRARLSALQAQMDAIARAYQDHRPAPGPPSGLLANWERRLTAPPSPPPFWSALRLCGVATALILVAGAAWYLRRPAASLAPVPPVADAWAQRVTNLDERVGFDQARQAKASRQDFDLLVERTQPRPSSRTANLTVWSDAASERQAWRLEGKDGQLRLADWRQRQRSLGERGVLTARRPGVRESLDDLEVYAADLIRRQPAKRLRLAAGLFRDLCQSGFVLSEAVEQQQKVARLTARRGAELAWLDVDAQSGTPVALGLSSDAGRVSWRIVLRLRQELAVNVATIRPGTFEPPVEVVPPLPVVPAEPPLPTAAVVNWRELELRVLAFALRWRTEGERIRTKQLPGEGILLSRGSPSRSRNCPPRRREAGARPRRTNSAKASNSLGRSPVFKPSSAGDMRSIWATTPASSGRN